MLPDEFLRNYSNLSRVSERVREAWRLVKEVVNELMASINEYHELYSLVNALLKEISKYEREEKYVVGLIPYLIVERKVEKESSLKEIPNLAIIIPGEGMAIVISMAATADIPSLGHVILHELMHSIGFLTQDETLDEEIVDYLTDLIIESSKGNLAKQENLTYTPKCQKECGILGASAQYFIDNKLTITLKNFKEKPYKYLDEGTIVDLN